MFTDVGIYRTGSGMENALDKLQELKERYKNVKVSDTGKIFNTELMNAWELGNMLDVAEAVTVSALNRTESRGGHAREDYPQRDDENWLRHSLIIKKNGKLDIGYKPVVITKFQPKAESIRGHMEVTVKIFRYNPEKDKRGHYQTYNVEAQKLIVFWMCWS